MGRFTNDKNEQVFKKMMNEQRKVGFATIFDLLKQKPVHLIFGTVFTVLPFIIGGIFILVLSLADSGVSKVDYELINSKGTSGRATIVDIEIQGNISIDNEHPRIISYSYKDGDHELNDKFRTLDSIKTSSLKVG